MLIFERSLLMDEMVALIAGGTAGHVNLALSVAEAISRVDPRAGILFVGTRNGLEVMMLTKSRWAFEAVPGLPFQRTGMGGKIGSLVAAVRGFMAARRLLRAQGVTSVIGFGAYASVGGVLAARSLGIHTSILEPNAELGMANRLLRRFVDRVFIGWEECDVPIEPARECICGVPIRGEIEALEARRHDPPASTSRPARILIMAGAEESHRFNEISRSLVRRVAEEGLRLAVRHQTGPADVAAIRHEWDANGIEAMVDAYLPAIAESLDWADLVIARSGASMIAEVALIGRPALFVPLPEASEDHQGRNAELIARRGGALWSRESSWDEEKLQRKIVAILSSAEEWLQAAERMRRALRPGAAERIARQVLSKPRVGEDE